MEYARFPGYQLVPTALLPNEDGKSNPPPRWTLRRVLEIIAGVATGILLALIVVHRTPKSAATLPLTPSQPVTEKRFVPEFPTVTKQFKLNNSIWNQREDWNAHIPSHGFIKVPNPHLHGLVVVDEDSTDPPPEFEIFNVSVFHQMHCLAALSDVVETLMSKPGATVDDHQTHHIGHCFDYIRQALMCAGDMALERSRTAPMKPPSSKREAEVMMATLTERNAYNKASGLENAVHTCKDWDQIIRFADSYRAEEIDRARGRDD